MNEPPTHWLDGGDGADERTIAVLNQDAALSPPTEAKERAWAALSARMTPGAVGSSAAGGAPSTAASTGLASGGAAKALVLLSAVAVVAGAAHFIRQPERAPERPVVSASAPREAIPAVTERTEPPPIPEVAEATKTVRTDSTLPRRALPARPEQVAVEAEPEPTPTEASPAADESVAARTTRLREESALLVTARHALRRGAPDEALAILADSGSKFPNGELGEEREALAIEAWWSKGAREKAQALAATFFARHPTSPYTDRLRQLLR